MRLSQTRMSPKSNNESTEEKGRRTRREGGDDRSCEDRGGDWSHAATAEEHQRLPASPRGWEEGMGPIHIQGLQKESTLPIF